MQVRAWVLVGLLVLAGPATRAGEADGHVQAALVAKHAGDLEAAERELAQALELDSTHPEAHFVLAWVLVERQALAAAIDEFCTVINANRRGRLASESRSALRRLKALPAAPSSAPEPKRLALTFDDGPTPGVTHAILDTLAAHHAKATFFVVGNRVRWWPGLVRREVADGHEVELHGWDHSRLTGQSDDALHSQVERTRAALLAAGAPEPRYLRPPYGAWDDHVRAAVGLPLVLWSGSTEDWRTRSAPAVVAAVLRLARPGAILLMHDLPRPTADALPTVLTRLQAQGYELVTVHELLGDRAAGEVITR